MSIMKKLFYISILSLLIFTSCVKLDLNPLSEASSGNWNSTLKEVEMSVNDLYKIAFWGSPTNELGTDDQVYRDNLTFNKIVNATITGETNDEPKVVDTWFTAYKAIGRANYILSTISRAENNLPQDLMKRFIAEVKFARANQYAKLIFLYGDVVYYSEPITLNEAYNKGRTSKAEIINHIYEDFDAAIEGLPKSYSSGEQRATKGAAYALKARTALYYASVLKFDKNKPNLEEANKHFAIARDAAKACMDLGIYSLYPDFEKLFVTVGKKQYQESIFVIPQSVNLNVFYTGDGLKGLMPRMVGGFAADEPTWELFCSFLATDGKTIDKSPLYDPHNPFLNRDPRLAATIVEFGTEHLGYIYQPHPNAATTLEVATGKQLPNNDSKGGTNTASSLFASFNGLLFKKGIDNAWLTLRIDPDRTVIRYADLLLIYAESKIELNEIDASVLEALNTVRERAYKKGKYPIINSNSQDELRKILRIERRMEFAREGLRYYDIIRWRIAEKSLNLPVYGLLDLKELREKIVNKGLWFFPGTPSIDENGTADFSNMYNAGLIKFLAQRKFDLNRQYLWPIPTKELLTNPKLQPQNTGY